LVQWAESLATDSRVLRELQRFPDKRGFGEDLALSFIAEVRSRIISAARAHTTTLLSGECTSFIQVSIGDADFPALEEAADLAAAGKTWKDFKQSLIRTEMVACLETTKKPDEVLHLYVSPEFRMRAEARIVDMWADDEGACMETKGAYGLVDPTRVCNRTHDFLWEHLAAQHSQVVFNEGQEPYQDAFFKESLKTFVQIPGGVALHYINYTRAADLGRIERWVGSGKIEGSQKATVGELQRQLLIKGPIPPETPAAPDHRPGIPDKPRPEF
jgi:hypothetical protein